MKNPRTNVRCYPVFILFLAVQPHIDVTVRSQKRVTDFWDAGEQTVFDSVNPRVGNMKDTSVSEQPSGGDQRELRQ